MPRNPDKTRCAVPGCGCWAMRGHTSCRAHRDAELGPRRAGAPPGNLNALAHGAHSHPLPAAELDDLARLILDQPGDLYTPLGRILGFICDRVDDPLLALGALRAALSALIASVAGLQFDAELGAFLAPLPPEPRAAVRALLLGYAPLASEARLRFLRQLVRHRHKGER